MVEFQAVPDQKELKDQMAKFICDLASWQSFVTLTCWPPREPDIVYRHFKNLIRIVNVQAFGKNYHNKVGHCYGSYALALQFTTLDVAHLHFLFDRPLPYELLHRYWNAACGFAWIEPVNKKFSAAYYTSRDMLQPGCSLNFWKATNTHQPVIQGPQGSFIPLWWNQGKAILNLRQ